MKSKIILKMISVMLLLTLGFPLQSNSEDLCFNPIESKKLLVEIKYGQQAFNKLRVCQSQYSTSRQINSIDKVLIEGFKKDIAIKAEVSDTYKKKFIDSNIELMGCTDKTPSRFTWFSLGAGSTLIGSLIVMFLITK